MTTEDTLCCAGLHAVVIYVYVAVFWLTQCDATCLQAFYLPFIKIHCTSICLCLMLKMKRAEH